MSVHRSLALMLVAVAAAEGHAQLVMSGGADITMNGSAGSQIVFPDGSSVGTAAGFGPIPAGHGGVSNGVTGQNAFVGGGNNNAATHKNATIGAGANNTAAARYTTVGGGFDNNAAGNYATVGGGHLNEALAAYATIGGGGPSNVNSPNTRNRVSDDFGTVGGGQYNHAGNDSGTQQDARYATVGGGSGNIASAAYSVIGGGGGNEAYGVGSAISGGNGNTTNGGYTTVAGGQGNQALSTYAAVIGGFGNSATGSAAVVAGGASNTASGTLAFVACGTSNFAAGDYSFAAGRRARIDAAYDGSFVFADSSNFDFSAAAANQFAVRANGGVRFVTQTNGTTGVIEAEAFIPPGGIDFVVPSARELKENNAPVDSIAVLEAVASMPVERWNYKSQHDAIQHIGPYAEDFHAAFGLSGAYAGYIMPQDLNGVALAAIQGLNQKLEQKDAVIAAQSSRIAGLEARMNSLEARWISEQTRLE